MTAEVLDNVCTLRITEIFYSLQGETCTVGLPTAFIRLTGCPLRCGYCDSAYAFSGGQLLTLGEILETTANFQPRYVTVTGGEPLGQPNCLVLLRALCDLHYQVSLETSGALDISGVDPRVSIVMDLKTPDSQEVNKNRLTNLDHIKQQDQIKFVICSRKDYEWAKDMIASYNMDEKCQVLFSPSYGQIDNNLLADWILADNLPVRFQIQLHKYIWGDVPGK